MNFGQWLKSLSTADHIVLIFLVFGSVRLKIDGEKTLETSLDWIFNFGALLSHPTKGKILKFDIGI